MTKYAVFKLKNVGVWLKVTALSAIVTAVPLYSAPVRNVRYDSWCCYDIISHSVCCNHVTLEAFLMVACVIMTPFQGRVSVSQAIQYKLDTMMYDTEMEH